MLIIECNLTRAAKMGTNLAELKVVRQKTITLSNGKNEQRPVMGSVYFDGMPLGEDASEIKAPQAMETGDTLLVVDLGPGERLPFEVHRDGKVVWAEKELHEKEANRLARQAEKLTARTKAGI